MIPALLAATMTFTSFPFQDVGDFVQTWTEARITASNPGEWAKLGTVSPGLLLLMDDGVYSHTVDFGMAKPFHPVSFDYWGHNSYCPSGVNDCENGEPVTAYDNILIEGYIGSHLRLSDTFYMGNLFSTYQFGPEWKTLTRLRINIPWPDGGNPQTCDVPCSRAVIDNVTLTPVPVPAALWLFASALMGLGLFKWSNR